MWQKDTIEDITSFFKKANGVKAVILIGSFANEGSKPDEWSDLDLVVIGEDRVIDRHMGSLGWLDAFGTIFAIERNELCNRRVLRVCFEDFKRFDFLFIPYSAITDISSWRFNPFQDGYSVLFSQIEGLESLIGRIPKEKADKKEESANIAGDFWFKAILAAYKVVRNDLLVASHLALDLMRDCLVLKMKLRDLGGNKISHGEEGISTEIKLTPKGILDIIQRTSEEFDILANQPDNAVLGKSKTLIKWIKKARESVNGG